MKDRIKQMAQDLLPELIKVRRYLHAHPELSFNETETANYVFEALTQMGLQPTRMSKTGVVALIEGAHEGPVTALRADLDALPIQEKNEVEYKSQHDGLMHACGHDVHTTSLLGAAMILNALKGEIRGTYKLIFQPGEEKLPGGASIMIKDGVLENPAPSQIFGQHVFPELETGKVGFRTGMYMASADEIYLTVQGKGGHAAMPHQNIDTVLMASHIIIALQQVASRRTNPLMPTVLSFGKIEGLGATNVIPDQVAIAGTFRTFDEEWRSKAHELIKEIAENTAKAMGGSCIVDVRKGYPFVKNDIELTSRASEFAKEYLGEQNVVELDMRMTGEDFSYYTQNLPGCFYRLGTRNESMGIVHPVHTPQFDVDEKSLEIGAGLMAWLAIKTNENA